MMKKIILFQLNQLGYGGTEKAIFTFIKNINRDKYIPKIFFHTDYGTFNYYRRKILSVLNSKYRKSYDQKYNINFARKNDFENLVGADHFYFGKKKDFFKLCNKINIDIIHFNRGDHEDFYTSDIELIPSNIKICETNIFGRISNAKYMDRLSAVFFVSQWLMNKSKWSINYNSSVLYNPIVNPKSNYNLRNQFSIPPDAIVLGRISRPNLDDGLFVSMVLRDIFNTNWRGNIFFLVIGATSIFKESVKDMKSVIFIDPTIDEVALSEFYNTLDILLHYRKEGETFGMNIAEAMIHGKPVVSHYSHEDNAQAELLIEGNACGIIVEENNINSYVNSVSTLINSKINRTKLGENAATKAKLLYSEENVTKRLESLYDNLR